MWPAGAGHRRRGAARRRARDARLRRHPGDRAGMTSATAGTGTPAKGLCERLDAASLLRDEGGAIRVPVLARGRLVAPAGDAVLEIREATVDRATMRPDGHWRRLILPRVDAADLLYEDPAAVR